MANAILTNLAKAQPHLINAFKNNEMRIVNPSTYLRIAELTSIMMPDYMALRTREDRVIEAALLTRQKRAIQSARTENHTGSVVDSAVITPVWTTSADKFMYTIKQMDNNTFSTQDAINNQLTNSFNNIIEKLEDDAQDFIVANRTGINVSTGGGGTYNGVSNTYEFLTANIDTVIQKTKTVMEENGYKGLISIFADSLAYDIFRFQAFQGAGNDTNLSFQFDGIQFIRSIGLDAKMALIDATYVKGSWIVAPNDSIAALPWIPVQNRQGVVTRLQTYSSLNSPIDGIPYAVHTYERALDGTSVNGMAQDEAVEIEVSIDMSFATAPITVANETSLFAFAIK